MRSDDTCTIRVSNDVRMTITETQAYVRRRYERYVTVGQAVEILLGFRELDGTPYKRRDEK